jgi:N-acetylmuramoyl-L-alanine amidase
MYLVRMVRDPVLLVVALAACAPAHSTTPSAATPASTAAPTAQPGSTAPSVSTAHSLLPPIPPVHGPLGIKVVYPSADDRVEARDSSFLFGSVGTGDATLSINGIPVPVAPNGAWLAWMAIPPDSVMRFELVARTATDSATLVYTARRVWRFVPPAVPLWIDSTSVVPRGKVWWPRDEYLPISVRAAPGAEVRIRLPGGMLVPLVADVRPDSVLWGIRAFDRDTLNLIQPARGDRYAGVIRGVPLGPDPGPVIGRVPNDTTCPAPTATPASSCRRRGRGGLPRDTLNTPVIEAILGLDTVRFAWPVQLALLDTLPILTELDDDTARTGTTDKLSPGRARPGATYHWFFPTGTRGTVSGRLGDDLRLRLSRQVDAWIPAADAQPLARGLPGLRATVGSSTLTPRADRLSFRIPLSQRVPFLVTEGRHSLSLRIYSAVGDVNWLRYGATDPYLGLMSWRQAATDEVVFDFDLNGPVWGYRTRWDRNDLILEIRRPPKLDEGHPLAGRSIVVDPGHPPLGATGPTGVREANANLAVGLELERLLTAAGAKVTMTRVSDSSVDLLPRTNLADSINAELLISIHNNALPDGVNPWSNNGTSVFYNHPRSLPLARAVLDGLKRSLGIRDLGVGRGDLALVRPTWMPAVLCEGLFMSIPEQEAALASPEGQKKYAQGVFDGVEAFLKAVAAGKE